MINLTNKECKHLINIIAELNLDESYNEHYIEEMEIILQKLTTVANLSEKSIEYAVDVTGVSPTETVCVGPVQFIYPYSWGNSDFKSPVVHSPTYALALILFDTAIKYSNDHHHIFLERIDFVEEIDGVNIYEFLAGS